MKNIDILVGLQFGSEGKGKVTADVARFYEGGMRVQSVQAGHTVWFRKKKYVMRTIPCTWVNPNCELFIGAGAFIRLDLLEHELKMLQEFNVMDRLMVDYRATIVEDRHAECEARMKLKEGIGSTCEGAGASLCEKLMRSGQIQRVEDCREWFSDRGVEVGDTIKRVLDKNMRLLIEGAQGTLLSVHTSPYYPFVTSRECTAAGILSETGLPIKNIRNILGVFRTYPIRVGGNSGKTATDEVTWEKIMARCGSGKDIAEYTTVTKRLRRVFEFSLQDFKYSLMMNEPTHLFMTFADYIDNTQRDSDILIPPVWNHIKLLEKSVNQHICYVGISEFKHIWRSGYGLGFRCI